MTDGTESLRDRTATAVEDKRKLFAAPEPGHLDRQGPCDKFGLGYYLDDLHRGPEHRYCECGWTEAHHLEEETRRHG